ncbi:MULTISPECIES: hypothetical protein [unclassified Rhizobium]|uniref:hypothetical protein n=1 Tax=unclassified Rhizobium TaxID=2613769 RepID=UPI0006FF2735|nr:MULTISPECIES: hypothetical protein [unclassified Rhizobium]KQV38175.1 hypothetical protein ASC86_08065 [Rhizobium sp. Root1212]KRD30832.1 hypothetical protein ASE37_08060 [Rhizobium sp. Root268]
MYEKRPDQATMIGLHKLAGEVGDGLVPELYAFLADRPEPFGALENVMPFPIGRARLPRRSPHAIPTIARAADDDNILTFPQPALPIDGISTPGPQRCGARERINEETTCFMR